MSIRTAAIPDEGRVRLLYLAAFDDDEKELVARLAGELLHDAANLGVLHLVAEEENRIIGHIAFSPVKSGAAVEEIGYMLAPLAVDPGEQKKGIGSQLVREGLRMLAEQDIGMVIVYGDPNYYGRFGFTNAGADGFAPPFPLRYPFGWQAMSLADGRPIAHCGTIECVEPLNKPDLW